MGSYGAVEAPADEPKVDEGVVDAAAPVQGDVTAAENSADDVDTNAAAFIGEKTITVGETITLTSTETGRWHSRLVD